MRSLFTLLLLCICSFQARADWRSEMYFLGGVGKNVDRETGLFSGNAGIVASTGSEFFYFNAGVGLYYLRGQAASSSLYYFNYNSSIYSAEVAVGGGVIGQLGIATLRLGPDFGVDIGLSTRGTCYSIIPKAILSFNLGSLDLGIMAKASFPLVAQQYYAPRFYGGGIVLSF